MGPIRRAYQPYWSLFQLMAITLSLTILSCINTHDKNGLQFDSEKWKSGDMRTKGKMTDHILKDSLLIGKSKADILKMLGEPDQQTASILHYTVDPGIKYMNEPWTYWLSVNIDTTNGKVKKVWLAD